MSSDSKFDDLRDRLHGDLVLPNSPDYDEIRKVWNGTVDKRPAAIVRCAGVADVIDAVKFARESDLLVSVRCGGHSIAGKAVCDNGLMIDLSMMRSVHVDPARQIARVDGGATLGRLDRETQVFGLATTAGIVTHTGVGGLTLG
ncbi:MAG: FAD-binding protein [Candidatus Latescibacteria bacterium]|nr:FAD-binding protein [Candidatus Latescibacterota bacterium]